MNANIKRCSSYNDEHNDISFQNMVTHSKADSGTVDGIGRDNDKSLSSICTLDFNNSVSLLDHQGHDYNDHTMHFNRFSSTLERPRSKIGEIVAASLKSNEYSTADDWTRHLLQSFVFDISEILQQDKEDTLRENYDDDADADSSICQDSIKVTIRRRSKERSHHQTTSI